jgi:hypothetical protein
MHYTEFFPSRKVSFGRHIEETSKFADIFQFFADASYRKRSLFSKMFSIKFCVDCLCYEKLCTTGESVKNLYFACTNK